MGLQKKGARQAVDAAVDPVVEYTPPQLVAILDVGRRRRQLGRDQTLEDEKHFDIDGGDDRLRLVPVQLLTEPGKTCVVPSNDAADLSQSLVDVCQRIVDLAGNSKLCGLVERYDDACRIHLPDRLFALQLDGEKNGHANADENDRGEDNPIGPGSGRAVSGATIGGERLRGVLAHIDPTIAVSSPVARSAAQGIESTPSHRSSPAAIMASPLVGSPIQ